MLKRLLVSFLLFTTTNPLYMIRYRTEFNIQCDHEVIEFDKDTEDFSSTVFVNGVELLCDCGHDPVVVIIAYGKLEVYCIDCCPKIKYCERFNMEEVYDKQV